MESQKPVVSDAEIATGGDINHPRALTPYQVKAIYAKRVGDLEAATDESIIKCIALASAEKQEGLIPLGAIMEAVAEGMNCAEDAGEDPMSWIQSCVSRIKGITDLTDEERLPSLKLKINEHKGSPSEVDAMKVLLFALHRYGSEQAAIGRAFPEEIMQPLYDIIHPKK